MSRKDDASACMCSNEAGVMDRGMPVFLSLSLRQLEEEGDRETQTGGSG
jgi:hypothetical protein